MSGDEILEARYDGDGLGREDAVREEQAGANIEPPAPAEVNRCMRLPARPAPSPTTDQTDGAS